MAIETASGPATKAGKTIKNPRTLIKFKANAENAPRLSKKKMEVLMEFRNGQLREASANVNIKMVKYFVSKGADVNLTNEHGSTPLSLAADGGGNEEGRFAICEFLLSKGADPNLDKPLICAAAAGYFGICLLLIEHGADVNAKERWRYTPLMKAAMDGETNICALLVKHGARVWPVDSDGENALRWAKGGLPRDEPRWPETARFLERAMAIGKEKRRQYAARFLARQKAKWFKNTRIH
jgi:hypothetical protein